MFRFSAFVFVVTLTAFAAGGCKKKSDTAAGGGSSDDDKAIAQGDWVVEKVEILPADNAPTPDEMKKFGINVKDNLITLSFDGKGRKEYGIFTLDASKSPKTVEFTEANEKGEMKKLPAYASSKGAKVKEDEPEKMRGIYKFEGDKLVIAASPPGSPLPTGFTAVAGKKGVPKKDSGMVAVVYLVKKK